MKKQFSLFTAAALMFGLCQAVSAELINFEDRTGPNLFVDAIPSPQTLVYTYGGSNTATFNGGVILREATNLPANQTSLYGTADFGIGLSNPLTITFSSPITNFFLDVYNGMISNVDYRISDNAGHSSIFTLAPNLSGGMTQIGFAATGTEVSITSLYNGGSPWDFLIDNVHFNEQLPGTVPEPSTIVLLGAGLGALALRRYRKSRM